MSTFAISLVKDEADIIEATVSWMIGQVDHVIVADNGSTDGTRETLEGLDVELRDDADPAHYQARKMTALAASAAAAGAEYVIPFDADELVYSPFGRIADVVEDQGADVYPVALYDHRPTDRDPAESNPLLRLGWRECEASNLHKIACRTALPVTLSEGNHQAYYEPRAAWDQLVVRHFPYRSPEQFVRKIRNGYAGRMATDLPDTVSVHLREWGAVLEEQGEEALLRIYYENFHIPEPGDSMIFDPAPCR